MHVLPRGCAERDHPRDQQYRHRCGHADGHQYQREPLPRRYRGHQRGPHHEREHEHEQLTVKQKASNYWRLDETSGTTGVDSVGTNNLVEQAGVTHGAAGGIATNSDYASTFGGASDGSASTTTAVTAPTTFSESIWFRTTTKAGGKLLGFGNAQTGLSATYDRQIVMDNAGHLDFGVYSATTNVVATANAYNDGAWHQAVGTLSPTGGMVFYVDGVAVGSNAAVTVPQVNTGYWRIGGDNVAGWSPQPSSYYFAGTLDAASIYSSALTAAQVQQQYADSQGTAYTVTATPKDLITGTVGPVNQAAWTVFCGVTRLG